MISVTRLDAETFEVVVSGPPETVHRVTLDDDTWRALTDGAVSHEGLLTESFRFLLEREPNTSIMERFDISVIARFFPEWEGHIREWSRR